MLYDVGAGEALELPNPFSQFHDIELVEYTNAALASDFFTEWLQAHPDPIQFERCVGYDIPLFLGGVDEVQNLNVTDIDVYWTTTGQLRLSVLGSF